MPRLISNAKQVVQRIAHTDVPKINQSFKFFRAREVRSKILYAKANFSYVEVSNPMVGMTRGSQAS